MLGSDLAPTPSNKKNWGWFEIFNVWANDVQSLFGYTLAASLFLASGLNGWAVFAALILAGFFIMWLVNLSGKPSVLLSASSTILRNVEIGKNAKIAAGSVVLNDVREGTTGAGVPAKEVSKAEGHVPAEEVDHLSE